MRYKDIKSYSQRCEEHSDHQSGMVTNSMIVQRLNEEIDELREYIENQAIKQTEKQEPMGLVNTNDYLCSLLRQVHDALAAQSLQFLPPQREWVGLTEEQINKEFDIEYKKYTEAKLKEKNT